MACMLEGVGNERVKHSAGDFQHLFAVFENLTVSRNDDGRVELLYKVERRFSVAKCVAAFQFRKYDTKNIFPKRVARN